MSIRARKSIAGVIAFWLATWVPGCGDDEDPPSDAGLRSDAAVRGTRDTGVVDQGDASVDAAVRDAAVHDAGFDAAACVSADPTKYGSVRHDWSSFGVALVPLEELYPAGRATTLDEMLAEYPDCGADLDGGVDDEAGFSSPLRRTTGCGTVVFENLPPHWNRLWVFDATAGKLVAYAQLDDVISPVGNTPCTAAAYVGGTPRPECPTDVVEICR